MIIVLSPDDLVYDFKGNKKKPPLKAFPGIEGILLGPWDVVIYRYQNNEEEVTVILKSPYPEMIDRREDHD